MQDCQEAVVNVYSHPDLLNLISKIKPENIRDDLRQEIAVSLLEQPCEKVAALFAGKNLLRYAIKICWNHAYGKDNKFANTFRKVTYDIDVNDLLDIDSDMLNTNSTLFKSLNYLKEVGVRDREEQENYTLMNAIAVSDFIVKKKNNGNRNDEHEARLFDKYVELGSSRAVARYYQIPLNHVCNVVNKIKVELRCLLLQ